MQSVTTTHERCWEDIPWLVNGRLGEADQLRVLSHVESCAECREELQQQRVLQAQMRGSEDDASVPDGAWDTLVARLDAASSEELPSSSSTPRRNARWWTAAVWVQGVAIAALLAVVLTPERQGEYVTLSTEHAQPHGAIRVVFAPDAALTQVNGLLREIEATIVAGPSEAGVYTVVVAAADPTAAIAQLRQHKEVLFAESTPAAGEGRR